MTSAMTRREWFARATALASASAVLRAQHGGRPMSHAPQPAAAFATPADVTLRIGEVRHEIAPKRIVKTRAYNGQVPGPLLRMTRGRPVIVDVYNDTTEEDIVHWHGLHIPPDVDGVVEEGTPPVPPRGRRRYVFEPTPAGTRWYHSHTMAGRDFDSGTYTGQFGVLLVEGGDDQGAYDLDVPIVLHEWQPRLRRDGPVDVEYRAYSINGKMLGAGEPIRVREGQRIRLRLVNASATLAHQLALAGHLFRVIALDGNPVPVPVAVPVVDIGPGERVDAVVEMVNPGVWILGAAKTEHRDGGLGIVIEYADRSGAPRWLPASPRPWDYTVFGPGKEPPPEPDGRLTLAFKAVGDGHHWAINGRSYPDTDPIVVEAGKRYRWTFDNQSADPHPVHLHRHTFELIAIDGRPTRGLRKDVVVVPAWKQVQVDVTADQPGLALFHCHQQFHMDMGFMAMVHYRG